MSNKIAIFLVLLNYSTFNVHSIQIDNRLVDKRNDCFERIALGSMLPFEKTFRFSDTNSLKVCENLCLNDKECQTFAFGISARGNGTCQLSSKIIDATNARPVGTIFDPDFDLYARKTSNCFVDPNANKVSTAPRPGGLISENTRPTSGAFPTTDPSGRPVFIPPTSSLGVYGSTDGSEGTYTSTPVDFSTTPFGTYPETRPSITPTEELYNIKNSYSPTLTSTNRVPVDTSYGSTYTPNKPADSRPPSYGGTPGYPYPSQGPDPFPGYHPMYQYPLLFHSSNEKEHLSPEIYAQNAPSLNDKYYPPPPQNGYGTNLFAGRFPEPELNTVSYGNTNRYPEQATFGARYPETNTNLNSGNTGNSGYFVTEDLQETHVKLCFRRILAGKRVASQWVRRTLICGRLEDCQHECGEEKRFICEGFNYRLDPSGQGQGECELIEVPLSQMNLYSSHHNRDANLIRHPDYDYFERDRTSANCRTSPCLDCSGSNIKPTTYRPPSTYKPFFNSYESTAIDKYRPQHQIQPENHEPDRYDNFEPPRTYPLAGIDNYRPQQHHYSENRPPFFGMDIDRYGVDSNEYGYKPAQRPPLPSTGSGYLPFKPSYIQNQKPHNEHHIPPIDYHNRPDPHIPSPHKPFDITSGYGNEQSHHVNPPRPGYLDRDSPPSNYGSNKPSNFVPYLIGQDAQKSWGLYGGTYGQASTGQTQYRPQIDYWGLRNDVKRKDGPNFNYFELGAGEEMNNKYGPTSYGMSHISHPNHVSHTNQNNQWIRRPGSEDCSVKSSEGFRLHKGVVRGAYSVPNVHECEKMCFSESKFRCSTFSYRYSNPSRDNCLLCDRSYNLLDFYADIEPDRNNDIYSMSDDINICKKELPTRGQTSKEQCFLRSVESKRFYKAIVRDSLTARSIEDCQTECIRASKFTCRSFTFRFGSKSTGTIIDNCLLSDWPVRDMDKDRHLIDDQSFDVFERASYGYGCEIEQKEVDEKNVKLCYLGYGSSAKLTSNAIKKVITAQSELECKNECIRYRESSPFKCLSFSYGSHASTFNCEMSDLDQSELKNGIHFAHTVDRDFWLFSWVLDNTCRDKITTLGGGNRINSERRIDIFREPGGETQHYTVSGLPCRKSTKCEKNLISGFYSCEMENGEVGAWEYCCRESSVCGYSHGFSYSWCYVGDKGDQWRQCTSRSLNIIKTQYPNRKGDHFQRPPIPGGFRYRHLDEIPSASDRMSYELPLNSTLSNEISDNSIIDCKKDKNC